VVEQMNLAPRLREASTHVAGLTFLDQAGDARARVDLEVRRSIDSGHIELPRGDLAAALHDASRDHAEFIFGDSIASLAQDGRGVDVTFERSLPRRFDLVIGADGLHSHVRRLAFGPEAGFVRHAGLYVATLPLPREIDPGRDIVMLNAPGRSIALHPSRGSPLAAFIFWRPEISDFDHTDGEQHKRIVVATFGDLAWKVPQILDAVRASAELYFDSVSRVQMTDWARGRIALLGDASSCVSLFGDGSSLAIAGASTLAAALAESPTDHDRAFRQYQAQHGKLVAPKQKNVSLVASLLVPKTKVGISLRNRAVSAAFATYSAVRRVRRNREPSR
jgi:2-polyprenyl-6-methoxyphenol hydroxylase-like FAD-dependent oxidoreductase